jgi:beta-phosphoglucomutase-like phosphatase (HAD superfamily)
MRQSHSVSGALEFSAPTASRYYATQCIPKCKIPVPTSGFVTADDVTEGKPKPTPYLEGAKILGIDATKC